ncbi:MAG: ACP S-malonyltransferase [Hyphomicrobiales bacterium]|nr:ACP S-malonyltransferase [Hyphomicrobiales bacterium]MDE2114210.1 ACP S-malonyltransferase [Hyphomicrobiales bacterium]
MSLALVFPGQGSQSPGMGKALFEQFASAREVFQSVDDALGQKLTQTMFEGPEAELSLTANAQPALMAVSLAALRVLQAEAGLDIKRDVAFVAGHSLGEYSALAAADAFSVPVAARLLRLRGEAMQRAVPAGQGAMAALIGLDLATARLVASEAAAATSLVCEVANDNGGGQIVVSGAKAAIDAAIEIAKAKGAKRAILLQVSAPFHCSLMAPAAAEMATALANITLNPPCVPLVANVSAAATSQAPEIQKMLVQQVTGTVRWAESIAYMARQGVTQFVEIGSGKVLSGLIRRIVDGAVTVSVGTPADIPGLESILQKGSSNV